MQSNFERESRELLRGHRDRLLKTKDFLLTSDNDKGHDSHVIYIVSYIAAFA